MHEAVYVDQFDRRRWIIERVEARAKRDASRIDKRRAQSFATTQYAVTHGFGEAL